MRTNLRVANAPEIVGQPTGRWVSPILVALTIVIMALFTTAALWPTRDAHGQPANDAASSIVGTWNTACECAQGMVLEIVSTGPTAAVGRIKVIGKGSEFKYKQGDEIIRLTAVNADVWTGELLWRNTAGEQRWQPITMRRLDARLHGVSANDHCYEYMERVR